MNMLRLTPIAGPFVMLCLALPALPQTSTSPAAPVVKPAGEPAMQVPPDEKAYKSARAIVDQDQRAAALQSFLHDFPDSKRADRARHLLLEVLLDHEPRDTARIHGLAQSIVDHANKEQLAYQESDVAYLLAEALPDGIDLKAAETWAKNAVSLTTLSAMTAAMKASYEKYKVPTPSDAEIHDSWASYRAGYLQTLADVYFHEGMLVEASATLDQAQALNPTESFAVGSIFLTRGQIAHALNNDTDALNELELAEISGGMTPAAQKLLVDLYAAKHNGGGSGLDAELDKRYVAQQKPIPSSVHADSSTGRTVLLELFTGSACDPCVAADLGLDAVLQAYPRSEVVALSLDQHVPDPDPLANPDTEARFVYDSGLGTPTVRIDGVSLTGIGGDRKKGEKTFQALGKAIDADLDVASGVTLRLTASLTPGSTIVANVDVQVANPEALERLLAPKSNPDAQDSKPKEKSFAAPAAATFESSKLVLNFALVQQKVSYSGENGIRFHSMVVRSIAKPSPDGFPVAFAGHSSAAFTFNPASVSASLSKYLDAFAKHDDRFGATHFLMTDTSLPLDRLAVAAWVENPKTHKVVAAAFAPIGGSTQKAAR